MALRWRSSFAGLALAAPLVALAAWIVHGALAPGTLAPGSPADGPSVLPTPIELPAERLEERVDGGAEALRAAGCVRLRYWRLATPPADVEALFFRSLDGARGALEREAGRERTAGPGDEALVSTQSVYFRRGAVLVRVFLDPGTSAPAELLRAAQLLDGQLPHDHE